MYKSKKKKLSGCKNSKNKNHTYDPPPLPLSIPPLLSDEWHPSVQERLLGQTRGHLWNLLQATNLKHQSGVNIIITIIIIIITTIIITIQSFIIIIIVTMIIIIFIILHHHYLPTSSSSSSSMLQTCVIFFNDCHQLIFS